MKKIYILTYAYSVPIFVGTIEYVIVATNLKEAKKNIDHEYMDGKYVNSTVKSLETKHQLKTIYKGKASWQ